MERRYFIVVDAQPNLFIILLVFLVKVVALTASPAKMQLTVLHAIQLQGNSTALLSAANQKQDFINLTVNKLHDVLRPAYPA